MKTSSILEEMKPQILATGELAIRSSQSSPQERLEPNESSLHFDRRSPTRGRFLTFLVNFPSSFSLTPWWRAIPYSFLLPVPIPALPSSAATRA